MRSKSIPSRFWRRLFNSLPGNPRDSASFGIGRPKGCRLAPQVLRLYLAGDYANASDLYLLLRRHLKRIVIAPQDKGTPVVLSPEFLRPVGFSGQDKLLPYPSHSYPGYQIIQEYFTCPQKFLYVDLTGWERWQNRGQGTKFEIRFELGDLPFSPPRVRKENFVLFVTPLSIYFRLMPTPSFLITARRNTWSDPPGPLRPITSFMRSTEWVGFIQGTAEERKYVPFELFNPEPQATPAYHLSFGLLLWVAGRMSFCLSPIRQRRQPVLETLSISLTCTNGSLPESLRLGDISCPPTPLPNMWNSVISNRRHPVSSFLWVPTCCGVFYPTFL